MNANISVSLDAILSLVCDAYKAGSLAQTPGETLEMRALVDAERLIEHQCSTVIERLAAVGVTVKLDELHDYLVRNPGKIVVNVFEDNYTL